MTTIPVGYLKKQSSDPLFNWVIYDDFEDNSIDTNLWSPSHGSPYIIEEEGRIEVNGPYTVKFKSSGFDFPHTNGEGIQNKFVGSDIALNSDKVLLSFFNSSGEVLTIQFNTDLIRYRTYSGSWINLVTSGLPTFEEADISSIYTSNIIFSDTGVTLYYHCSADIHGNPATSGSFDLNFSPDGPYKLQYWTGSGSGAFGFCINEVNVTENYFV